MAVVCMLICSTHICEWYLSPLFFGSVQERENVELFFFYCHIFDSNETKIR